MYLESAAELDPTSACLLFDYLANLHDADADDAIFAGETVIFRLQDQLVVFRLALVADYAAEETMTIVDQSLCTVCTYRQKSAT